MSMETRLLAFFLPSSNLLPLCVVLCCVVSCCVVCRDSLKCYGKCKVSHVWQGSGDTEYDSDGVQIFDKFAVVLKFEDICTANRVKQK